MYAQFELDGKGRGKRAQKFARQQVVDTVDRQDDGNFARFQDAMNRQRKTLH